MWTRVCVYMYVFRFISENVGSSRRLAEIDAVDLCYSAVLLIKLICVHFFFSSLSTHSFHFPHMCTPVGLKIPIIDAHRNIYSMQMVKMCSAICDQNIRSMRPTGKCYLTKWKGKKIYFWNKFVCVCFFYIILCLLFQYHFDTHTHTSA